jgi:hypothetical protein
MNSQTETTMAIPTYTYDERTVSDLHKDAYGFRPPEGFWLSWKAYTEDQKQEEWDYLCRVLDRELEEERWAQAQAIESFETKVVELMALGAKDRLMAINWLLQSLDVDPTKAGRAYAYEELEWQLGLPYGYVTAHLAV